MAMGPVKLSKLHLKRQAAWGTKLTSFIQGDLMEVDGEFIPPANTERLQPDVIKGDFAEARIYAGSQATFDVSFNFTLHRFGAGTPSGNPTARNEHQLFQDVLGAMQSAGYITVGVGSTDTNLVSAGAAAALIGQGILAPITGGYRFVFPDDADPGVEMGTNDIHAAPIAGQAFGTLTAAMANVFDILPFTAQFAGVAANTGWRCWDGRVASLTVTANAKAQPTIAATLRFTKWEKVDALTAEMYTFPVAHFPAVKNVSSYDANGEFCPASVVLSLTQELAEVPCFGDSEGVSRLITSNRTAELTVRQVIDDAYTDNWRKPGDTLDNLVVQLGTLPGAAMCIRMPAAVVNAQEQLQNINNLWGVETVFRAYANVSDTDTGASAVENTPVQVCFA
jgi:hypothetical protein